MNVMDCWPCFSGHAVCTLHMLLLALFYCPTFCCWPGIKGIEQLYQAGHVTLTVDCCNDDYVTMFHLASHLSRTSSHVLTDAYNTAAWLMECTSLNDYHKLNSEYRKNEYEFEFINWTSNFCTSFNIPSSWSTVVCILRQLMKWLSENLQDVNLDPSGSNLVEPSCLATGSVTSVSTGPGPGPGPLRSNITLVQSQNIFLDRTQSMCT